LEIQQLRELRLEIGQSANQEIAGVTQPVTNPADLDEILGRPAIANMTLGNQSKCANLRISQADAAALLNVSRRSVQSAAWSTRRRARKSIDEDGTESFDFGEAWARFTSSSAASLPDHIVDGLDLLLKMTPPRGFPHARWPGSVMQVVQFATEWAPLALRLGWTPEELFGLDLAAPDTRHDRKGLAFTLSGDKHIVAVTESHAQIKAASGAHLRFYRQAASSSAVLAWELGCSCFRIPKSEHIGRQR
jgi:hypothetical protein